MIPCESWPARLALTQPTATARASSSDAPAPRSRAVPMRVRRSAWTIGIGFPLGLPLGAPAGGRVLLNFRFAWSQSATALAIAPRQILGCNAARARLAIPPSNPRRGIQVGGAAYGNFLVSRPATFAAHLL